MTTSHSPARTVKRQAGLPETERLELALRHPIRRRILRLLLASTTVSPPTLAESMPNVSLPLVSYHVRALVALGILDNAGRNRRRGRYGHDYRLVADPDVLRGQLWGRRSRVLRAGENDGTAVLDAIALRQFDALVSAFLGALGELERETHERQAGGRAAPATTSLAILLAKNIDL